MTTSRPATKTVKIAVDAMGGDFAPGVNVQGTLMALNDTPDLSAVLVGDEATIKAELKKAGKRESSRLAIVHSTQVISMEDHGASVIRKKTQSSIHVGMRLVKENAADAFISAGNSGAVMATALLVLGRLEGVERPAIVVRLPTAEGHITILDAGANVDCRPSHLVQFAEMGNIYSQVIEGIAHPRIALLSNGTEEHKGNELTRETQKELKTRKDLNYVGYVEGYHLFQGRADVVVCDGFVGNIALKLTEGVAGTAFDWFRKEIKRDLFSLVGVTLLRKVVKRFKDKFDYEPYGAAHLLGIDGTVLISHGGSSEVAIQNGILTAKRGVEEGFNQKIRTALEQKNAK